MRDTRLVMGMPVTVEIAGAAATAQRIDAAFAWFARVEDRFSPYRTGSLVSLLNAGQLPLSALPPDFHEVLALAQRTRAQTGGYFDIRRPGGGIDPSGIVKGWAIRNAAIALRRSGACDFYVEAGGDIEARGCNASGEPWRAGIRHPFRPHEIIKAVALGSRGMATSGSYVRGAHIYNPHDPAAALEDVVSITVTGPDVLEADRFATAAFAMGEAGIRFIAAQPGLEGYMVRRDSTAVSTPGFGASVIS